MQFSAKARFLRFSPYKLRPLTDVVRGKRVSIALQWLATCSMQRAIPISKLIKSAVANAKDLQNIDLADLQIAEIKIDNGPMFKYFKPGAMGRSTVLKKRLSHATVILKPVSTNKKV